MKPKFGDRIKSFFKRLILASVCALAIAVSGAYLFIYHTNSPTARDLRERVSGIFSGAKGRDGQPADWKDQLEALGHNLSETVQKISKGDESTSGLAARIEEIQERIKQCEDKMGPVYQEKLEGMKQTAEDAMQKIKDKAWQAKVKADSLTKKDDEQKNVK